ncbi:uncharacterized protein LOC102071631 [Zonotrichia albicollis]|uniref:uncharacterized protein LOC102071631 n=1 Tax=Zonotrichia albicollis TaxID=44394 RepID=UPI003D80E0A2
MENHKITAKTFTIYHATLESCFQRQPKYELAGAAPPAKPAGVHSSRLRSCAHPTGSKGRRRSAGRIFVQPGSRVSGQGCCSSRCGFSKAFGTERAGGSPRPPRFVCPPARGGPAGTGAGPASRRGHRAPAPGRAPARRHDAGGKEGWGGEGRGENAAGAGSKLRPSPTERRERPGPAGSAQGRRPRPKRDRTASSLPSLPGPPAPGPRPRALPLAARKFPREAAGSNRGCSPGAAAFPGAVSAPQGAASPPARAPSAASGLPGLAGPRALSARRAATCPRVAGEHGGSAGGARAGALLRSGRGGAPAAQRDAYRPPRAAPREHYGIGPPAPPGGEGGETARDRRPRPGRAPMRRGAGPRRGGAARRGRGRPLVAARRAGAAETWLRGR